MNKNQALQLIKQTLDSALKAGIITTMEQANAIIQALSIVSAELNNSQD
jgi:hypothetical protein